MESAGAATCREAAGAGERKRSEATGAAGSGGGDGAGETGSTSGLSLMASAAGARCWKGLAEQQAMFSAIWMNPHSC